MEEKKLQQRWSQASRTSPNIAHVAAITEDKQSKRIRLDSSYKAC